jgi:hypothetical protein
MENMTLLNNRAENGEDPFLVELGKSFTNLNLQPQQGTKVCSENNHCNLETVTNKEKELQNKEQDNSETIKENETKSQKLQ